MGKLPAAFVYKVPKSRSWPDSIVPWALTIDGRPAAALRELEMSPAYPLVLRLSHAASADLTGAAADLRGSASRLNTVPLVDLYGLPAAHHIMYGVAASYLASGARDTAAQVLRQTLNLDLLILDSSIYDADASFALHWMRHTLRMLAVVYGSSGMQERADTINGHLKAAEGIGARRGWPNGHRPTLAEVRALVEGSPELPRSLGWHSLMFASPSAPCSAQERAEREQHLKALERALVRSADERSLFLQITGLGKLYWVKSCLAIS